LTLCAVLKLKNHFSGLLLKESLKSDVLNLIGGNKLFKVKTIIINLLKREGFAPGLFGIFVNPFYFARLELYRSIRSFAPSVKGKILDVGCGSKPYKHLFQSEEYIGMEIDIPEARTAECADVFYDGITMPFPDSNFDSVFCSQVFEHVFDPDRFLSEINRVLKNGGTFLLTVPFIWDEHEQPRDYGRYTSFGILHVLSKYNFTILQSKKTVNDIRLLFQLLNEYLYKAIPKKRPYLFYCIIFILSAIINIIGIITYKLFPINDDLFLDNVVLCQKKQLF
jgi:SAM-dependent methyltransferase